jgi:hypothetical protein
MPRKRPSACAHPGATTGAELAGPPSQGFRRRDVVTLVEVAERWTQTHGGHNGARIDASLVIREALAGGCPSVLESIKDGEIIHHCPLPHFWRPPNRLDWVNALNQAQRLQEFPDRPWPWELHVALSQSEREALGTISNVFLLRAEAVRWGLWPVLEPQSQQLPPLGQSADASSGTEAPLQGKQPDKSAAGGAEAPQEPQLQLTYDQMAEYIGRSRNAVRHYVARHHLPTTIGSDGKALVIISQKVLDQLRSTRSPEGGHQIITGQSGDDRVITTRSPGDHPPVGEAGAALPPAPAPKTEAVAGPAPAPAKDEAPPHEDEDESDWKKLRDFVAAYIKKTHTPTASGCWNAARNELPSARRERVLEEYGNQAERRPPGRPRKT